MYSGKAVVYVTLKVPVTFHSKDKEEMHEDACDEAVEVLGCLLDSAQRDHPLCRDWKGIEMTADGTERAEEIQITEEFCPREDEREG